MNRPVFTLHPPLAHLLFMILAVSLLMPVIAQAESVAPAESAKTARELQQSFISIARNLKPSVVNIRVEKTEQGPAMRFGSPYGDELEEGPFEDFFKKFFKNHPRGRRGPKNAPKSEGMGSGVIFDPSGVILTNNHVIKSADKITVKLSDGKEFKAKIVGQDPQSDLAVIKVDSPTPLQAATFADSSKLEPGQWCMAIGNPFGLEQTVTVGVVSALSRSGLGVAAFEDFIQTDCSINPGNSGGPLIDLEGNVIGINTLIFAAPGSGIGFSIPSNMAKRIASQIVSSGSVERPYMGISMREVTPDLSEHYNLKDRDGAVIMEMTAGSPGAKAGLQQMDIIREIDGNPMKGSADVQKHVLSKNVGDTIQVKVLRNGTEKTIDVALEKMPKTYGLRDPEDITKAREKTDEDADKGPNTLGFAFQPLTAEIAKSLRLDAGKKGLVVTDVADDSPAAKGGLEPRDVITQVNGQPVNSEDDLQKALKALVPGKKSSVFVVLRGGNPLFLVIPAKEAQE